jgi:hypothetical protein
MSFAKVLRVRAWPLLLLPRNTFRMAFTRARGDETDAPFLPGPRFPKPDPPPASRPHGTFSKLYGARSPFGIHCCNAAPTPTGFTEIVSDYSPLLHALHLALRATPRHFSLWFEFPQMCEICRESRPFETVAAVFDRRSNLVREWSNRHSPAIVSDPILN